MKYFLLLGLFLAVFVLAWPGVLVTTPQPFYTDPAHLGMLGMGLLALGMARKHQNKDQA